MPSAVMVASLLPAQTSEPSDWVDRHGDYLFNYALGQLRNRAEAEDLVQETFLAAFKARDRFHGHSSERTWLVSILRHKVCDHFRRKCRERRADDPLTTGDGQMNESMRWVHETAAECISPSRHLDLADFMRSLEIALHALPPRIAQAFTLYEMEECPSEEICRDLEISQANLWTMVHRARRQLRQLLAPWANQTEDNSYPC